MVQIKKLTILAISIFAIASCGKKDTTTTTTTSKTKTQLLTQKTWKLTNVRYKINSGSWVDAYSTVSSCVKDNIVSYSSTGSYSIDEAQQNAILQTLKPILQELGISKIVKHN